MDDAIVRAVRQEHGLLIGRNAARNLKMTLGLADAIHLRSRDGRRGRGAQGSSGPAGLGQARRSRYRADCAAITSAVEELLSDIPPNLAEEVVRGKIRLAGGGALLPGLAYRIETAADIAVMVVDDPLRCVIRGAAQILELGKKPVGSPAP